MLDDKVNDEVSSEEEDPAVVIAKCREKWQQIAADKPHLARVAWVMSQNVTGDHCSWRGHPSTLLTNGD